jgi:hypothetical protein
MSEAMVEEEVAAAPKRRRQRPSAPSVKAAEAAATVAAEKAAPNVSSERVWITLEENKNIPPRGQFFGINGMGFILRPGKRAYVPKGIVDILDNATQLEPQINPDTLQIDGWVEKLRFPYRLHANG